MSFEGKQLGHYHLLYLIGSGGMGEVYLAEDTLINRQVAIKVIRTEPSPYPGSDSSGEAARLFQREAQAIARLNHPQILPLFDYGEETIHGVRTTYMVMPFCKEGSLATWLKQHSSSGSLPPRDVAHFLYQAADALQHAHEQQIIHQDVKPPNFLIRSRRGENLPDLLLTDFGVAKLTATTSIMTQSVRGTPAYMPPEQWQGHPVLATDQYALAIMAYQLLTGRLPFQGGLEQMLYQHLQVQPVSPSQFNPHLSPGVDGVLLHALAKKPEDRFPSIFDFARTFQQTVEERTPGRTHSIDQQQGNDLRTTLTISQQEALAGTTRSVKLPGGRQETILIPAGTYDGQLLRLEGLGEPASNGGRAGTLIVTIVVRPTTEQPPLLREPTIAATTPAIDSQLKQTNARPRSGRFPVRIVLLVGLAFLVIAGSIGIFSIVRYNQTLAYMQATATAQTRATQVAPTHDAETATASIVLSSRLTATAIAPTITLANTASQNPYPPHTGRLVLNDSLNDNNKGLQWRTSADTFGGNCQFTQGAYHASETQAYFNACMAESSNYNNFVYQVQMRIITGDYGGILFRSDDKHGKYYYFRIGQDGSYDLYRYDAFGSNGQSLVDGVDPAINSGLNGTNVIAIVARSGKLDLYVNLQLVNSVNDTTYTSGQIGVVADGINGSTEVVFSNAKVWTL